MPTITSTTALICETCSAKGSMVREVDPDTKHKDGWGISIGNIHGPFYWTIGGRVFCENCNPRSS